MSSTQPQSTRPSRIRLPIDEHLSSVKQSMERQKSVILLAEPGAGKTTRVPVALSEPVGDQPPGRWIVLQPRRWAAKLVANRIAEENGWQIGREVGYQIRFESKQSAQTRVLLMTEGVLLRKLIQDPELKGYAGIILDEFHERSLDADLALSLLKEIQESIREDLKIVVMSATMDPRPLLDFLPGSSLIEVAGRVFPVQKKYLGEASLSRAIRTVLDQCDEGDVLVFLPGAGEIIRGAREIEEELERMGVARAFEVLPLYSALPEKDQKRVFDPSKSRKIILSTNIAETSITLPGIRAVVDSGLAKILRTDPQFGQDKLETLRISLASAEQRAGRAGRVGPGFCFRLWTEDEQMQLRRYETPEIHRVNLSSALAMLSDYGVRDFDRFSWFEKPKKSMLDFSLRELHGLNFLSASGELTARGRIALQFPLSPRLSELILVSKEMNAPEFGAWVAAWMENGRDGVERIESLESLIRTIERSDGQVRRVAEQLYRIAGNNDRIPELKSDAHDLYLQILVRALSHLVFVSGNVVGRRRVVPLKDRMLPPAGVLIRSRERSDRGQTFIQAMAWVPLPLPVLHARASKVKRAYFDHADERVRASDGLFFHDLALSNVTEVAVDPDQAFSILIDELKSDPMAVFCRDEGFARFWKRAEFFAKSLEVATAEEALGFSSSELLESACLGKTRMKEVAQFPAQEWIESQMDRGLKRKFEEWAPEKIEVPSGSLIRVDYHTDPPKLSVRLQELFGLAETPRLAGGKVPLLMELLSPGFKPMQLTRDLKSFWDGAYFEVKKELKAQYPKHSWPDDPWTATAVAKGRRRS